MSATDTPASTLQLDETIAQIWHDWQAQDPVQRRAVVMLDTQFRMHPVLGDFMSREFYEKEKLDPVKSGRPASSFLSNIPGHAKRVCCWIDVPWSDGDGRESRQGIPSWHRKAEGKAVAAEAKRLLEACGDSVSIGVITFYSAQRDAIFRELKQFGLVDRDTETGEWLIADEYRKTRSLRGRSIPRGMVCRASVMGWMGDG